MISDTAYLLKECNAGCRMATNSLQQAISHADDQRSRSSPVKYRLAQMIKDYAICCTNMI